MAKRIYIPITGGLGNQLFQIAAAMSLTKGEIVVLSCLGEPRSTKKKPDSQQFKFPERIKFYECRKRHTGSAKFFNLMLSSTGRRSYITKNQPLNMLIRIISAVVFSLHFTKPIFPKSGIGLGFDKSFQNKKGNFLIGYFQTYRFMEDANLGEEFKKIVCVSENDEYLKILNEVRETSHIMLHVRLGDYSQESAFGILSEVYFKRALDRIKNEFKMNQIMLFSDEPEKALLLIPHELRKQLSVIPNNGMTSAETLQIMRNCKNFIISNSSFSWWAAYLAEAQPSTVIYPIPWFIRLNEPNELIPNSWFGIGRY
jgi:hypothetical protein